MGRNKGNEGFAEKECCICGRVFLPAVEHVFHVTGRWCCTYPCYLKLQAQIEAEKAIERERICAERARKIAARKARRCALQENSYTSVKKGGERK